MNLSRQVHRDGSFALRAGTLAIENSYPALDGQPVHPLRVAVTSSPARSKIVYTLDGATLTLRLDHDGTCARLACSLRGPRSAPHWIQPISCARVSGPGRFFRHGLGFPGPGGFVPLAGQTGKYRFGSYPTGAAAAHVAQWLPAPAQPLGRMATLTVTLAPHACRLFHVSPRAATPPARLNPLPTQRS